MNSNEVKGFVYSLGADVVGIASSESLQELPGYKPTDLLAGAKSTIVFGKRLLKGFLGPGRGRAVSWGCIHLNIKLDEIAYDVAKYIEDRGYNALPVFFVYLTFLSPKDQENFDAILKVPWFPYVPSASVAGLGEVGLNHLIVTPQYGPRVRLMSVITDAPLIPDAPFQDKLCPGESCGLCIQACPVQAFSPDGQLDKLKCHHYHDAHQVVLGYGSCAMCIQSCPVGK